MSEGGSFMAKILKKLGWAFLVAVLVVVIFIVIAYFLGRMSTPPWAKAQDGYLGDVSLFCGQTTVVRVENDGKGRVLYRIVLRDNYQKYANNTPSEIAIENIYLICMFQQDSYGYIIESENFAICTDDATEDNPEFAQFLKDNRWGEEHVDKPNPVRIDRPKNDNDENFSAAAQLKAETAAGKNTGDNEEYCFSLINYDCNGKYLYVYFDKIAKEAVFYKITVSEEEATAYAESGEVDISQGVEITEFDPYKYKEILVGLSQFFR